jgi:hypothetical protein
MNADRKSRVKTDCKMPGMAYGGKAEGKMMKAKGRNMTKAAMQKIADKKVKGHEARMHKGKK